MQEAVCLQAEWKDTCLQAGNFEQTFIHLHWNAKANYCKNCWFFQQSKTLLAGIMRGIPAFRQVILDFLLDIYREIIRGKYFENYESLLKYKILPAGRIGRLPGSACTYMSAQYCFNFKCQFQVSISSFKFRFKFQTDRTLPQKTGWHLFSGSKELVHRKKNI